MNTPETEGAQRARVIGRAGWKIPATPPPFDDARLLEYWHPAELPRLCVSLATLILLLVGAAIFKHKAILLGIAGTWLAMIVASLQAVTYNLLRGVEVTPTQFPAIYQIVQELSQRFQAPPTRVFVIRRLSLEAETLGFKAPYSIMLPSLLLDSLDNDELRCILGRALGQIRFGHTRMAILLGGDEFTLPELLSWLAQVRDIIFSGYRRAQVLSADRAGILAGGLPAALESLGKLSLGKSQALEVKWDDLVDQACQLSRRMNRLQARLIIMQHTTPPLFVRLRAMVEWAGLPPRQLR